MNGVGNHDAEQAGWETQHPLVRQYRAVKEAMETALAAILTADGHLVEPARPGQSVRVHVPGTYCPTCTGTGDCHQMGCPPWSTGQSAT